MALYKKVDTNLNFASREKEVENFWAENKIAEKAVTQREGCKDYTFYDGPPTANGQPHIGHVLTRVIKDLFPRYHSMKGEKVLRKAGWDTHGLPVELEVENLSALTARNKLRLTALNLSLKNVVNLSGSIRQCGKNFPALSVFGLIWKILTSLTKIIISSPSGGR